MRLKMAKEPINSVDTYQGDDIMALAHARSGELITLTPLTAHRSETLTAESVLLRAAGRLPEALRRVHLEQPGVRCG